MKTTLSLLILFIAIVLLASGRTWPFIGLTIMAVMIMASYIHVKNIK